MMVIGCLQLGVTFAKKGWPQIQEAFDIATGDPSVGAYEIRLLASGSEVEFAGGIQFGAANELRKLLDETPEIKTIHLNSHGGRTAEARRMRDVIRQKRLTTYTSIECLSACTIAYLGGEQRFIHPRAKLGFHKSTFPGLSEAEIRKADDQSKSEAVQAGIAVAFLEKAFSTPHEDMWMPSTSELLTSGYVTHVSNGQFGLSGFGSQPNREALAENLREVPIFAAVAAADSARFEKMVDLYVDGVSVGRSETAVFSMMRAMMSDLVQVYAPTASDEALMALANVLVEELALIGRASADACHDFLFPTEGSHFDIRNYVGPDVQQRDIAATEMIIRTGMAGAKQKLTNSEIDWLMDHLIRQIERKHGNDAVTKLAAMGTSAVTRADTCQIAHILYSEALNMPLQFRAKVIRRLFSQ
jgi:ATP-dependent protease ClpP protease subunit